MRLVAAAVVVDIEGTTSATESVHRGLYDYARPRLEPWIEAHGDDPVVAETRTEAGLAPDAPAAEVVAALHRWMDADVKATPLKTLQGQIWAAGFAAGELTSHFFPDVASRLRAWRDNGLSVAVFSSGSVASQRPWFRHGAGVDLSDVVSAYFDTVNAGPKREPASYRAIAAALGVAPIVFLSDVPAELDAAVAAGWLAVGVQRPTEPASGWQFGDHAVVGSFDEIDLVPSW